MPVGERLGAPACFFGRSKPLPYRHTLNLSLSVGARCVRLRTTNGHPYELDFLSAVMDLIFAFNFFRTPEQKFSYTLENADII